MGEREYVPISEAADYLGMREETILRMIRDRRLGGWVDWAQVEALLIPIRGPRR